MNSLTNKNTVKQKFEAEGKTISSWADDECFNRSIVYVVISGRIEGKRGQAHEIAVKLGLKPNYRSLKRKRFLNH